MTTETPTPQPQTPEPPKKEERDRVLIPAWLLKAVATFCAREKMRFILTSIQVTRVESSMRRHRPAVRIAGTDGRCLCAVDIAIRKDDIAQIEHFAAFYLDAHDLAYLKVADLLEISGSDRRVWSKVGGSKDDPKFEHRLNLVHKPEGIFPNVGQIIDAPSSQPMGDFFANAELMLRLAKLNTDVLAKCVTKGGVSWCGPAGKGSPACTYASAELGFRSSERNYVSRDLEIATFIMPMEKPVE